MASIWAFFSQFFDSKVQSRLPLQQLLNPAFYCFAFFLFFDFPFRLQFCHFFCVNWWNNKVFNNIHFGVFLHNTLQFKFAWRVGLDAQLSFKLVELCYLVDNVIKFIVKHVIGLSFMFGRFFWLNNQDFFLNYIFSLDHYLCLFFLKGDVLLQGRFRFKIIHRRSTRRRLLVGN